MDVTFSLNFTLHSDVALCLAQCHCLWNIKKVYKTSCSFYSRSVAADIHIQAWHTPIKVIFQSHKFHSEYNHWINGLEKMLHRLVGRSPSLYLPYTYCPHLTARVYCMFTRSGFAACNFSLWNVFIVHTHQYQFMASSQALQVLTVKSSAKIQCTPKWSNIELHSWITTLLLCNFHSPHIFLDIVHFRVQLLGCCNWLNSPSCVSNDWPELAEEGTQWEQQTQQRRETTRRDVLCACSLTGTTLVMLLAALHATLTHTHTQCHSSFPIQR